MATDSSQRGLMGEMLSTLTEPDPDLGFFLGGHQIGEGSRGPPRPPVGPGQSPGGGFRVAKPPDAKRFSAFQMPIVSSPLSYLMLYTVK